MATGSDFDHLVILDRVERDPRHILIYRQAAHEALRAIGASEPGQSGLFGVAISGAELVNTIGLEGDTNLHLSRRVLLLEESVPLNAEESWAQLIEAVAARYLHELHDEGPSVPRFLLNDVVRYWRTIAVDYQAKRWQELTGEKWGLRYAKLITTRKLTFAAMVATLFSPVILRQPVTAAFLREQFSLPSLARLAQLAPYLGDDGQDALREVLLLADRMIELFGDADFRDAVKEVDDPLLAPVGSAMDTIRKLGDDLQSALESLFFCDEPLRTHPDEVLGRLTRRYLSF